MGRRQLFELFILERQPGGQKLVQDDAHAVQVTAVIHVRLAKLLGADEFGRANQEIDFRTRQFFELDVEPPRR